MSIVRDILRACGIAALCLMGFAFIPGACITAYVAGEVTSSMTGNEQWGFIAMAVSLGITVALLMIGESLGE